MRKNRPNSARRIAGRSKKRTACAPDAKRPWKPSGRSWRNSKARRPPSAKNTPPRAPNWPAWRNGIVGSAPPWSRSEAALEAERQELEKLEGQAATIGEEYAATRAELAGLEERHRGERSAMVRLERQFHETSERRNSIAPEIERLGEQRARLLADNIELDQRAAELAGEIAAQETCVLE